MAALIYIHGAYYLFMWYFVRRRSAALAATGFATAAGGLAPRAFGHAQDSSGLAALAALSALLYVVCAFSYLLELRETRNLAPERTTWRTMRLVTFVAGAAALCAALVGIALRNPWV